MGAKRREIGYLELGVALLNLLDRSGVDGHGWLLFLVLKRTRTTAKRPRKMTEFLAYSLTFACSLARETTRKQEMKDRKPNTNTKQK